MRSTTSSRVWTIPVVEIRPLLFECVVECEKSTPPQVIQWRVSAISLAFGAADSSIFLLLVVGWLWVLIPPVSGWIFLWTENFFRFLNFFLSFCLFRWLILISRGVSQEARLFSSSISTAPSSHILPSSEKKLTLSYSAWIYACRNISLSSS